MARISRKTREILEIVIFLLVVAVLLTAFVIYPLSTTKSQFARPDLDDYNPDDTLTVNSPGVYAELNASLDTFFVDADGLTTLACLYVAPIDTTRDSARGTILVLHKDDANRDSVYSLAAALIDSGFAIATYDQRASRYSGGKYRGEGRLEADDLDEVIRYLDLRKKLTHPVIVTGYQTGADAAMIMAREESRIDAVVAVNPYLTTKRLQDMLKDRFDSYWLPFYRTVMWFWYEIRSGYAVNYRKIEQLEETGRPSILFIPTELQSDETVFHLAEISDENLLEIRAKEPTEENVISAIMELHQRVVAHSGTSADQSASQQTSDGE